MPKSFWFILNGINPVPWTSPTVSIGWKGKKPYSQVYSSAELKNYKEAVAQEVTDNYPEFEMLEDEIALRLFFWRRLDSLNRGTKRKGRGNVADATNLQKSTEDALQGVLFKNDIQVINADSWIMAQGNEVNPRIVIELIWHPDRPKLPSYVTDEFEGDLIVHDLHGNFYEIPIEDLF